MVENLMINRHLTGIDLTYLSETEGDIEGESKHEMSRESGGTQRRYWIEFVNEAPSKVFLKSGRIVSADLGA